MDSKSGEYLNKINFYFRIYKNSSGKMNRHINDRISMIIGCICKLIEHFVHMDFS